ncbi:hypothetical protein O7631_29930 [Micromonospora sp. WMMD967]|nr:hypothetical protein [Micromonospora sp. WMMD967]MDG4840766.1 hypothetical protein [Micromonospora sp. WMMD967]
MVEHAMTARAARPADRPVSEQRGGFESTAVCGGRARPEVGLDSGG